MARDRVQELLETTNEYLERARVAEAVAMRYRAALVEIEGLPKDSMAGEDAIEIADRALVDNFAAVWRFQSLTSEQRRALDRDLLLG